MKTILNLMVMLFCITTFSQEQKVDYKRVGNNLIKATYYFADNSSIIEKEGFFNDAKKLHGVWISYDIQGNKTAIANYKNGKKDGVWQYIKKDKINLITYKNNKIISVEEKLLAVN